MMPWLRLHARTALSTLARFARAPLATFVNATVIGVTLALPLGGWVALDNARRLSGHLRADPQLSVFLAPDAARGDLSAVEAAIRSAPNVRGFRFVPRDEALAEVRRMEGLAEIAASLGGNPLPDAYRLQLASDAPEAAEALANALRKLPGVAQVQLDVAWVRRLDALLRLGTTGVAILAAVLALALVAVTFNTIRLQILTQREEIEVCKLVGATDAYVRRPFQYQGALLGLFGGFAALAIVWMATGLLERDVGRLAASYGSDFALRLPAPDDLVAVLAFASALGWVGAALAVSKHLHSIHPR